MQTQTSNPAPQYRRKLLFYILGIALVCVLSYFVTIYHPRYLEVTVDLPGEKDWWYADRTFRAWDDGSKFYIWRRETTVSKHWPDNFETQEAVIAYIEKEFVSNDWQRIPASGWTPCDSVMPESTFLEWGKTYLAYQQEESDWIRTGVPILCLAVWPEDHDSFHVVIMTKIPSLLTVWRED